MATILRSFAQMVEWQTHNLEVVAGVILWRFESSFAQFFQYETSIITAHFVLQKVH